MHGQASRRSILRLAALVIVLIFGGSAALIAYTWSAIDQQEATRETALVRRTLTRFMGRLGQETISGSVWDEAYKRTSGVPDLEWVDRSLGGYYHPSFKHDLTLLLNPEGRVLYVARDGARTPSREGEPLAAAVAPWIRAIQEEELERRLGRRPPGAKGLGNAAWRTLVLRSDGDVYALGIATVVLTAGIPSSETRPASVVISGRKLDGAFLQGLEDDLGVRGVRLIPPRSGTDALTTAPLVGPTGDPVATVVWSPVKPGIEVLERAQEVIALVLVVLLGACIALGLRIRTLFHGLAARDRALETTLSELMAARDAAQAASVAKGEFIANISHEIRTPLNGMLGMVQVLERENLTPAQHERVRVIRQSGGTLLSILNDVLDMSKIEAGKLEVRETPFRLEDLLASTCGAYRAVAETKGIGLDWSAGDAVGDWLGDADRTGQIVLNLVSNAIKFTEAGRVTVEAEVIANGLTIAVRDEGVGIPADKLARIFESFSQIDSSTTRRAGGTGLGLAISRRLALLMGGDIAVESREGEGSVFRLELPLPRSAQSAQAPLRSASPAATTPDRALRVLAAEDNATNQLVLRALLEPLGVQLTLVADGAQAVEACSTGAFDLVLMDIQMPVMDGLDATAAIRDQERAAGLPAVPIIALTANAMRHHLEAYAAAGLTAHVAKPIDATLLYAAIESALAGDPSADRADAAIA